jgi:hypothetical protein
VSQPSPVPAQHLGRSHDLSPLFGVDKTLLRAFVVWQGSLGELAGGWDSNSEAELAWTAFTRSAGFSSRIVRRGLHVRKVTLLNDLAMRLSTWPNKSLILLALRTWLTSLDNFRNWLIHSAAS